MSGLRVLLTNNRLDARAGTPLYVRDVALGLLERGHTPVVYSTKLGDFAEEMRKQTIPVVADLCALATPPDVIHGQQSPETMTALLQFPDTPAVFFYHDNLDLKSVPPNFPRILRYVAVDHTCRDRLLCEHAIPEERVHVLLNSVDLKLFTPRAPLPPKPRRALLFSNYASQHLAAVQAACARTNLTLDVIGADVGRPCAQPEAVLGDYDIVFAKARCALEALAVGAAVVLCDFRGVGPMVTSDELARLRALNFGHRTLRAPIEPETIVREIMRYDPQDAAKVARAIRATAGREQMVDEIVALYREVLDEHAAAAPPDRAAERRAVAAYLRQLTISMQVEQERFEQAVDNSTTMRLQRRLRRVPVLGTFARALARKLAGRAS